ncbi:hypothetical protein K4L44_08825 [Halosquirtibacter laminarini]|uniref:Uncharacterized protein n=1 Tax=Halosquirtibacter laminarini TaxID=3374600 RepID=A0AC61NQ63_9BACT|nr:hypothetical protein K4L44_08825 [Prolixibacteraceae bacterium]
MMKYSIVLAMIISLTFTSCNKEFYQLYKVKATTSNSNDEKDLVFEDENCIVRYDLWSEGGRVLFEIFNKTDKDIYLDKSKCFFVLNGKAYDYYQNRSYCYANTHVSSKKSVANYKNSYVPETKQSDMMILTNSTSVLKGSSSLIVYKETDILCIPSNTSRTISEFTLRNTTFRDCELMQFPSHNKVKALSFDADNSPIVFENRFQYYIEDSKTPIRLNNNFYVEEIVNLPKPDVFEMEYEEYCGEKSMYKMPHFKDIASNAFYIKYLKTETKYKH